MSAPTESHTRVLAFDPSTRGFGFVIMEGPRSLIEWGARRTSRDKNAVALERMVRLIKSYGPDLIVIEDCSDKRCRRSSRVKRLAGDIIKLAARECIPIRTFSRRAKAAVVSQSGASTKRQIATTIAEQFPELFSRRPPVRKPWKTEDYRMALFDAMALALTFFSKS